MTGSITEVGARLQLLNSPAFIRNANAAAAAVEKLTAAITAASAAAEKQVAANDALAGSNAKVAESAGVAKAATVTSADAAVASGAVVAGSTKAQAIASTAAADAALSHAAALNTVANNPIVKKGAWVGAGLVVGAYEALKMANTLQAKITQLSTQAGASAKDIPFFTTGALQISNQLGINVNSVADALYRVKSASVGLGQTNKQILQYTTSALQLSVLSGGQMTPSQLDNTARVIGAFQNAQLRGAKTPDQTTAMINAAVGAGDIRMGDVIGMIGKGGLAAAQASHMSASDMFSWMDVMTKLGGNAQNVGTLTAHAALQLQSGSKQSQEVQQMIGIAPGQLAQTIADPKQGLGAAFTLLQKSFQKFAPLSYYPHTAKETGAQAAAKTLQGWGLMSADEFKRYTTGGKLSAQEQQNIQNAMLTKMFGGARQMTPELVMLENMMTFKGTSAEINAKATPAQFQKDLALAMDTPLQQLKIAGNKWHNVLVELGLSMEGPAKTIAKGLGALGSWFAQNLGVVEAGLGALAAYAVASVGFRVMNNIAKFAGNVSKLGDAFGTLSGRTSGLINTLTGGRFGTAATAQAPTTEFAGAVFDFSAAVTRFGGETLALGGKGVGAAGAATGAAGGAASKVGAAEAAGGAAGLSTMGVLGAAGVGVVIGTVIGNILNGKNNGKPNTTNLSDWIKAHTGGPTGLGSAALNDLASLFPGAANAGPGPKATPGPGLPSQGKSWDAAAQAMLQAARNPGSLSPDGFKPPAGFTGWEGNVGGRLQSGTGTPPPNQHVHVYIDGKEVFAAVQANARKVAARN